MLMVAWFAVAAVVILVIVSGFFVLRAMASSRVLTAERAEGRIMTGCPRRREPLAARVWMPKSGGSISA